jgi:hypothetical protein
MSTLEGWLAQCDAETLAAELERRGWTVTAPAAPTNCARCGTAYTEGTADLCDTCAEADADAENEATYGRCEACNTILTSEDDAAVAPQHAGLCVTCAAAKSRGDA